MSKIQQQKKLYKIQKVCTGEKLPLIHMRVCVYVRIPLHVCICGTSKVAFNNRQANNK